MNNTPAGEPARREATEDEYENRYGGPDDTFPVDGTPDEIRRWAHGEDFGHTTDSGRSDRPARERIKPMNNALVLPGKDGESIATSLRRYEEERAKMDLQNPRHAIAAADRLAATLRNAIGVGR